MIRTVSATSTASVQLKPSSDFGGFGSGSHQGLELFSPPFFFFCPPFSLFGTSCLLFFGFFGAFGAVEQVGDFVAGELFAVADIAAHVVYEATSVTALGSVSGLAGVEDGARLSLALNRPSHLLQTTKPLCDVEPGCL